MKKPWNFTVALRDSDSNVVETFDIPKNPQDQEMARITQFIRNMIEDGLGCNITILGMPR